METQSPISAGIPDPCILLGGQPRSGTSLLTSILRSVPGHLQAFELHIRKPSFVVGLDGRYTRNIFKDLNLPPPEFDDIVAATDITAMNLGAWCGPKEDISAEQLTGTESNETEREFAARSQLTTSLLRRAAALNDASTWGFKILSDIAHADLYQQVWPNARFILLIRDPRDQAASLLKLNEQRSAREQPNFYDDYRAAALGWRQTVTDGRAALAACDAKAIELRYEDLVQNTVATLRTLSDFVNLDLATGLNFHEQDFIDAHTRRFKHHDNLRQPINPSSVGRWRQEIGERDSSVFQEVAGDLMESLDYVR